VSIGNDPLIILIALNHFKEVIMIFGLGSAHILREQWFQKEQRGDEEQADCLHGAGHWKPRLPTAQ